MSKMIFKGSTILNPVPVVLVTSMNNAGEVNVLTIAWTGTICTRPPMVSISVRPERLSYDYIKETEEFVINLPSRNMVKKVDYCGVVSGRKVDKIKEMGFTLEKSEKIKVPSIAECHVSMECRVKDVVSLGSHDLFIAEVLSEKIDESIIDKNGKIHFENADLITYSHGEYFPLPDKSIGKFGYSIKKHNVNKKRK
ncbi:MAG: flavin reductase family protein [Bacillota bacterium]|nr:flavin reductase family protein [Bacillota bacterium]